MKVTCRTSISFCLLISVVLLSDSAGGRQLAIDRLGQEWSVTEAGITGHWVRRGTSDAWDGNWVNGAAAILSISIVGDKMRINRKDVGFSIGLTAKYEGTLGSDGSIQGTETATWPGHFTNQVQAWQGRIAKGAQAAPPLPASARGLSGTMKDYNGNTYKTIRIGSQVWMAENLKVKNYRNGDPIPNVTEPEQWGRTRTGAYCSYENSSANADIYGYLYNWYAATDKRNIAPAGWHVPNNKDWTTLIDQLGGEAAAGNKLKETGIAHWKSPNFGATNESGFTGLPDGTRAGDLGGFWFLTTNSNWWSTDEMDLSSARCRPMTVNSPESIWGYERKNSGLSIRLVKDDNSANLSSVPPQEITVFDSMNIDAVANRPTAPVTFSIRQPHIITSIMTYHWNDGRGTRTGTIALRDASGRTYGPWPVIGTPGQGGVPNAAWTCNPNVEVAAGTYTIVDSEPVTWSQNPRSGGRGMAVVKGYPIDSTKTPTKPSLTLWPRAMEGLPFPLQ